MECDAKYVDIQPSVELKELNKQEEPDETWMPPFIEYMCSNKFCEIICKTFGWIFAAPFIVIAAVLCGPFWLVWIFIKWLSTIEFIKKIIQPIWHHTFEKPVKWAFRKDYRIGIFIAIVLTIYTIILAFKNKVMDVKFFRPFPSSDLIVDNEVIDTWSKWIAMGIKTFILEVGFNLVDNSVGLLSSFAVNKYMPRDGTVGLGVRMLAYVTMTQFEFLNWARTFQNELSNIAISVFQLLGDIVYNVIRIYIIWIDRDSPDACNKINS